MKIGIDFDKCYRADPETWSKVVEMFHRNGHDCVLITKRRKHHLDQVKEVKNIVRGQMPIIFAGEEYKDPVAKEHGHNIDVWIDDHPEFIRDPSEMKDRLDKAKYQKFLLKRKLAKVKKVLKSLFSIIQKIL